MRILMNNENGKNKKNKYSDRSVNWMPKYIDIDENPYWRNEYILSVLKEKNLTTTDLYRMAHLIRGETTKYFKRPFERSISKERWEKILRVLGINKKDVPYRMANPKGGKWLKNRMKKHNMSYADLSEATGISQIMLQKVAGGERIGTERLWTKICYYFQTLEDAQYEKRKAKKEANVAAENINEKI